MDPRIRTRTKMTWIRNTGGNTPNKRRKFFTLGRSRRQMAHSFREQSTRIRMAQAWHTVWLHSPTQKIFILHTGTQSRIVALTGQVEVRIADMDPHMDMNPDGAGVAHPDPP